MGIRPAPESNGRLTTWHVRAGLFGVLSCVLMACSLVLFAFEVFAGGYSRWTLVTGLAALTSASLARWAEARHKNALAAELARLTTGAVEVMRDVAGGTTDPDEAARVVEETTRRINRFRAENGLV